MATRLDRWRPYNAKKGGPEGPPFARMVNVAYRISMLAAGMVAAELFTMVCWVGATAVPMGS